MDSDVEPPWFVRVTANRFLSDFFAFWIVHDLQAKQI
jgi:hypothetical protein